jgi:hypothetical protein
MDNTAHATLIDAIVGALPLFNLAVNALLVLLHVQNRQKINDALPQVEAIGVQLAHTAEATSTTLTPGVVTAPKT